MSSQRERRLKALEERFQAPSKQEPNLFRYRLLPSDFDAAGWETLRDALWKFNAEGLEPDAIRLGRAKLTPTERDCIDQARNLIWHGSATANGAAPDEVEPQAAIAASTEPTARGRFSPSGPWSPSRKIILTEDQRLRIDSGDLVLPSHVIVVNDDNGRDLDWLHIRIELEALLSS
jgi:hypothetical protein